MCENQGKSGDFHCRGERIPSFVQPRLLLALAKKSAHGYELIERLSGEGNNAPDPGNLYRVLRMLEEDGVVCSTWDTQNSGPARRVYELTDQGLEYLHTWVAIIQQTHQSLGRFLSDYHTLLSENRSE